MPIGCELLALAALAVLNDARPPNEQDIQMGLEQVSAPPLPYQAVRLRFTIANKTAQRLGPLFLSENTIEIQIRATHDDEYRRVPRYVFFETRQFTTPSAREKMDSRSPLFLEPNGVVYLSFPIVADWVQVRRQREGEEPRGVWIPRPLFHRPDKYAVKCSLRLGEGRGRLEQIIHVEVREAQEDDAKVLRELIKDEAVISAVMRAGDAPEEAVMVKLRDFMRSISQLLLRGLHAFRIGTWLQARCCD